MKRYPAWKHALVLALLALALVYALPSAYPSAPTVEVRARTGSSLPDPAAAIDRTLAAAGIRPNSIIAEGTRTIASFDDNEAQLEAKLALDAALGDRAVTALASATTAPDWLHSFGATPVALGLDLRGGAHFLLETDAEFAVERFFSTTADLLKRALRDERIPVRNITVANEAIVVVLQDESDASEAADLLFRTEPRLF